MKIIVEKITDIDLARTACEFTMHSDAESKATLHQLYKSEHSPIRTQLFKIKMYDIPTSASVHFVRHSAVGQLHYVKTNRPDRGAKEVADRDTPVNHLMILNSQHLIDMARQRLCYKAAPETGRVMERITNEITLVDDALGFYMMPNCQYRNMCPEMKSCGKMGY